MYDGLLRRSASESSFLSHKFPLRTCKVSEPSSIFVANLSSNMDNQKLASDVYDLFSKFGEIYPVRVCRDSLNRPFAFVNFKNGENTYKLLHKKLYLHSRLLRIERTRSNCTLEIPNVSDLQYKSIKEIEQFLLTFGPIEKLSLKGSKVYCTFTSKHSAMHALFFLQGNQIDANLSKPIHGIIWVGNLPDLLDFTEEALIRLFSVFGSIIHVQIFHASNLIS